MKQISLFNQLDLPCPTRQVQAGLASIISADKEALSKFKHEIFFALLHRDPHKYRVIDQAIQEAKEKGISYVLCKISDNARRFRNLARQVKGERIRAISFMRLQPFDQHGVLFGEFELKHQTAELIMLHFMRRFPRYRILLLFGEEAYLGKDKQIYRHKIEARKITLPKAPDEFEKYWLAFYRSQFISERKNLRYLKQMIPKKYWKWVTELREFGIG